MSERRLTVIDLFSGAGGFSLGFHAAGCRILAAADSDAVASETFRRNFARLQPDSPPHVHGGSGGNLDRAEPEVLSGECPDIVIGGPPCQAFSRLGRAKLDSLSVGGFETDPRNSLYRRFLDAVEKLQPRAVVMENVPGMLTVGGVNYAGLVTGGLAALGYRAGYAVLNAVWYGVPQFRERIFFIGIRADQEVAPSAPPTTHATELPDGYTRPVRAVAPSLPFDDEWDRDLGQLAVPASRIETDAVSVREALDDLPASTEHLTELRRARRDFRIPLTYQQPPHSDYARLMRTWAGFTVSAGVDDHVVRRTPRDYEIFRRMQPGDRFPEALAIARGMHAQELERLAKLGQAPSPATEEWEELETRFVPPYDDQEFPDKWRKLIPERPAWTIPAHLSKDSYSHIHYDGEQARMISIREAARLQSFPDAFLFTGNMGDCFRQIGNAVPPLLGHAIARRLLVLLGFPPA